jgi:hypothetical protein
LTIILLLFGIKAGFCGCEIADPSCGRSGENGKRPLCGNGKIEVIIEVEILIMFEFCLR